MIFIADVLLDAQSELKILTRKIALLVYFTPYVY